MVPLRPRSPDAIPPLSSGQERLWFLHRLDPTDASYNMYPVQRLRGPLDADALTRAFTDLAARHETLRTRFPERDGAPVAVVEPPATVPVEHLDLTGLPPQAREDEARRLVAQRTNAPFDLAAAPPLRVTLLRLADDDHVLCTVLHHIIGDGWSLRILTRELVTLYQARVGGTPPDLPPLPVQYGDVAVWQRTLAAGPAGDAHLDYWRQRLADPPLLELPLTRPRSAVPTRQGAFHSVRLADGLVADLELAARERRVTMFMVLLAAYQVLLARHTGQTDILVGSPAAGRDQVELESLIGYLTNTLVLRGDLSGDPTFTDLLKRTRRTTLEALAHQNIPFERLLTELDLPRDVSHNPLLSTMVILNARDAGTADHPSDTFADLKLEYFEDGFRQSKFDLVLEAWRDTDGLLLALGYSTDVLDAETVTSLAARLETLLEGIAADPDLPISALPLHTAADDATLRALADGGHGAATGTVPELFEAQVARTPHAVAVVCGDEEITYAELDNRVRGLAARLRQHGVAAGSVIGVCLGRSVELVAAMLAVWRAGGAYLPLDPDYPADRLAFLVGDSGVAVALTQTALASKLPATVPTVLVDEPHHHDPADPETVIGTEADPADTAYVIYTSGSTGQPKGVVVEHRNLAARVTWMRTAYDLHPGDHVVQFASSSFDTHAEEIYPTLTTGATLVLLPDGASTLPDVLATPAGQQVTVLDLPTAYFHHLVDLLDEITLPQRLRLVILGGEQVHAAAVTRWHTQAGDHIRLVNTYGPTEATIIATAANLTPTHPTTPPPIGRPITNTTTTVTDHHGQPVPPGAVGELHVGGVGVARGYHNQPALTASRFTPDPAGPPGARRYRTGDRVRWRADGQLDFLGRLDQQVKIRGFRVEPGEIEALLLTHPQVSQAAVVARDGALAAYVVGAATADELRQHLTGTLPPHMVPSAFVGLDTLPLTVTGKLDRAALPVPEPAQRKVFVAPRTDAEELVASVWAEVLGLDQVGALDDFFTLGGHSLLALRVAARLRRLTDVEVPIRTLFTHRTVTDLATAVEELLVAELTALSDEETDRLLSISAESESAEML